MYVIHLRPSAPADYSLSPSPLRNLSPLVYPPSAESAHLCFSVPAYFPPPPVFLAAFPIPLSPLVLSLRRSSPAFLLPQGCPPSVSRLPSPSGERAPSPLYETPPPLSLPLLSPLHSRERKRESVSTLPRRRRVAATGGKTESESQGRRGRVSMAEARGQGERAGSPTLTSNKGGELMRAGARADTCGYRPTPTIKPSTTDPRKTLELNPPCRAPPARQKREKAGKNFSALPAMRRNFRQTI